MKTDLKIILVTQGVSRIVEPLFSSGYQIVGILESASRNYNKQKKLYKFVSIARNLYSVVARQGTSLKGMSKKQKVPYRLMMSSDDPNLVNWIKELKPDVIVVFSMSQLLKEKIFNIPRYGTINLHPSFLPDYRGPNPDFWQYHDMEMTPGATVHYIDKGEDTGDVIFQERVHVPLGTKSPQRLDLLIGEVGVSLILKVLEAIQSGTAPRIEQPVKSPTVRARNLTPGEHKTIIDWQKWPIERVWHVLCGTEMWLNALPQPKGLLKGQRWVIEDYKKQAMQITKLGEIAKQNGCYYVACKDGKIYLTRKFRFKDLILSLLRK
jgi:methionyl-tRNA formyltransferase